MVEKYFPLENPIAYMNTIDLPLSGYRERESVMSVRSRGTTFYIEHKPTKYNDMVICGRIT